MGQAPRLYNLPMRRKGFCPHSQRPHSQESPNSIALSVSSLDYETIFLHRAFGSPLLINAVMAGRCRSVCRHPDPHLLCSGSRTVTISNMQHSQDPVPDNGCQDRRKQGTLRLVSNMQHSQVPVLVNGCQDRRKQGAFRLALYSL